MEGETYPLTWLPALMMNAFQVKDAWSECSCEYTQTLQDFVGYFVSSSEAPQGAQKSSSFIATSFNDPMELLTPSVKFPEHSTVERILCVVSFRKTRILIVVRLLHPARASYNKLYDRFGPLQQPCQSLR